MNVSVRKANVIASYIREIHNIYTRGDFHRAKFLPMLTTAFRSLIWGRMHSYFCAQEDGSGLSRLHRPKRNRNRGIHRSKALRGRP